MFIFVAVGFCGTTAVSYAADTEVYTTLNFDHTEIYDGEQDATVYVLDEEIPYFLPEPELEGYTFAGWYYTDLSGVEQQLDVLTSPYHVDLAVYNLTAEWYEGEVEYDYVLDYTAYKFSSSLNNYVLIDYFCSITEKLETKLYAKSDELIAAVEALNDGVTEELLATAKLAILTSIEENIGDCTEEEITKVLAQAELWLGEIATTDPDDSSYEYTVQDLLLDVYVAGVDYSEIVVAIYDAIEIIDSAYDEIIDNSIDYTTDSLAEFESDYETLIANLQTAETFNEIDTIAAVWSNVESVLVYQYIVDRDALFEVVESEYSELTDSYAEYTEDSFSEFETSYITFLENMELAESVTEVEVLEAEWGDIKAELVFLYEVAIEELTETINNEYNDILLYSDDYTTDSFTAFTDSYSALIAELSAAISQDEVDVAASDWEDIKATLIFQYEVARDELIESMATEYTDFTEMSDVYTTDSLSALSTSYDDIVASLDSVETVEEVETLAEDWQTAIASLVFLYEIEIEELFATIEGDYSEIMLNDDYYTEDSLTAFQLSYEELIMSLEVAESLEEVEALELQWSEIKLLPEYAYEDAKNELVYTINTEYSTIIANSDYYTADSFDAFCAKYNELIENLTVVESLTAVEQFEAEWVEIKLILTYVYIPSEEMSENLDTFLTDPTEENLQSAKDQIVTDVSLYIRACEGEAVNQVLTITSSRLDEIMLGDGTTDSIVDNLYSAYYEALTSVQFEKSLQSFLLEIAQQYEEIYYSGAISMQSLNAFSATYEEILIELEDVSQESQLAICMASWEEMVAELKQLSLFSNDSYVYSDNGFSLDYSLQIINNDVDVSFDDDYAQLGSYSINIFDTNGETLILDSEIKVAIKISDDTTMLSVQAVLVDANGELKYVDAVVENGYIVFYTDTLGDFVLIYEEPASIYIYFGIIIALIALLIGVNAIKSKFAKNLNKGNAQ
ncbi:MAG: hypothetical protein R3Y23_02310 [Bacillota bacterium]